MENQNIKQSRAGFFSRKRNIFLLAYIFAAALLVVFAFTYLYISDAFKPAPRVSVYANNTYDETLCVVTDIDYEPFSYLDENGAYAGLDVELINEIANRLHINLDFELLAWPEANRRFLSGNADAILNMETDSVADDGRMIATIPTTEKQYVVYGQESVSSVAELYGKRVVSLHQMPELGLEREITYLDSYAEIFEALKSGEYDFAICPIQVGNVFLEKMDIRGVYPSYAVGHVYGAIALSPENAALRDRMNEVLSDLQREGWMDKLDSKWISNRYQSMTLRGMVGAHPWLGGIFVLFLLLAAFLTVSLVLQRRNALAKDAYTKQLQKSLETINRQSEELREARDRAEASNRAKTTFLSNMSHDIRTPMNAIVGFTNLAKQYKDDKEKVSEYLDKIQASSNHLLSLINDVLEMSRIESGKIELDDAPCSLPDVLHELNTIIIGQVESKQQELTMDAVNVMDENILCDKLRLNQVLLNLLSNAIKYTPAGGKIAVRVIQHDGAPDGFGAYELRVKDNGIGMTPEFAAKVFEAFEREKTSTVSGIQGTGLGMAITKRIVDLMGGTIDVVTAPNEGTEFIVKVNFRVQAGKAPERRIAALNGIHALVVDDDFDTCDSTTNMLVQMGLRSEWTLSGKEAVLRARQAHERDDGFGVFIIDWRLPDLNGIEAARKIRTIVGGDAPILLMTAYDWPMIRDEAIEAGVTGFCNKPLFMSELYNALVKAVGDAGQEDVETAKAAAEIDFTGKRLLLVDDMEINREIAATLLDMSGFAVEEAADGSEAVRMVSDSVPGYYDAVLMDVQMPVMNGYDAARAIRGLSDPKLANIPIIAMTANAFDEDKKAAFEAGMNGHVAKPIDVDKLIEALRQILYEE